DEGLIHAGLRSTGDHRLGVAAADRLPGLADRMPAGRAGGHGREVRAGHAEADRHLSGADIGDAHRDEERADPVRSAGGVDRDALDERPDTAQPGPEDHAGPPGLLALHARGQARLVHGLTRGHQPELDVAVRPPHLLLVEDAGGIEVLDLTGDPGLEAGRVEGRDPGDPRAAGDHPVPRGGDIVAERRQHPHARDHHAAWRRGPVGVGAGRHRTSLPVRTVAARYTSPARPRAEIAFATAIVSNSARRISARASVPSISTSAHEAVGSPSKTSPAEPSFTIIFQPRSRTSGRWVWPQQMTRASVREIRSRTTDGSSWVSKPCVCEPGDAWQARTIVSSSISRRSDGSRRSQASRSSPSSSWAHSAAARNVSGTPSVNHGNAAE